MGLTKHWSRCFEHHIEKLVCFYYNVRGFLEGLCWKQPRRSLPALVMKVEDAVEIFTIWRLILIKRSWPPWWDWELELSPHLLKRMDDRCFDEVDLRSMLEKAGSLRQDVVKGRWVIETRHRRYDWEVIVEPDEESKLLVVVTAYPCWEE